MLSYQHHFHAGNYADILKHFTHYLCLDYLIKKPKPLTIIDTHSGAGLYSINQPKSEADTGFLRIKNNQQLNNYLKDFVNLLNKITPKNHYSGSAFLSANFLRQDDNLYLYERHPQEYRKLKNNINQYFINKKIHINSTCGWEGLISKLPPINKRALVLIDPPFELKGDYQTAINTLQKSYQRFKTGCYILWYPLLPSNNWQKMRIQLKKIFNDNFLIAEIMVDKKPLNGFGMYGSGLFIINPPYLLKNQLQQSLPILTKLLSNNKGSYLLDYPRG